MRKKTHKEFIKELKIKNPEVYRELKFLEEYDGKSKKILAKDRYGYVKVAPSVLLRGASPTIILAVDKTSYWINMIRDKREDKGLFYDYSKFKYEKDNVKSTIICPIHGEFLQTPNGHMCNKGCSECAKDTRASFFSFTHGDFLNELKEKNTKMFKELKFIDEYKNCSTPLLAMGKLGLVMVTPMSLLAKGGYSIRAAVNKEEFLINSFKEQRMDKGLYYDYSKIKYGGNKKHVGIVCPIHGVFWQSPLKHLGGQGCPNCGLSRGESAVGECLTNLNVQFESQYKFEDCKNVHALPFDFYIDSLKIAIEYDGIQHYEPIEYFGGVDSFNKNKKRDAIKTNYCKDNEIKLVRIPYWDFDNIEKILKKELNVL